MSTSTHTPTPWKIVAGEANRHWIETGYGTIIARCETYVPDQYSPGPANAEFICRAVNSHDALLAACKESLAWYDEVYPADVFTGESGDPGAVRIRNLRESCAAAISQAEAPNGDRTNKP